MELKSSTILITGGTSGIGLEFVKQLTQQGASIIVTGRNVGKLNKIKQQFPQIHTFQNDVSNPKDMFHSHYLLYIVRQKRDFMPIQKY